jgi:hypothetical protein
MSLENNRPNSKVIVTLRGQSAICTGVHNPTITFREL